MYMRLVRRGGKDMRGKLKDLILSKPGAKWCELSNFNSIIASLERKGIGDFKRMEEMLAFNSFISDSELIAFDRLEVHMVEWIKSQESTI
jgi:hypothetical protein